MISLAMESSDNETVVSPGPEKPAKSLGRHNRGCSKIGKNGLTLKERAFTRAFVETGGNGTRAALASYGTANVNVASAMAPEVLARPRVQSEIVRLLDKAGLTDDHLTKQHARVVENCSSDDPALVGTGMRAVSLAYRLKGYLDKTAAAQAQQLPPTLVNVIVQVLGELGQPPLDGTLRTASVEAQVADNVEDAE